MHWVLLHCVDAWAMFSSSQNLSARASTWHHLGALPPCKVCSIKWYGMVQKLCPAMCLECDLTANKGLFRYY